MVSNILKFSTSSLKNFQNANEVIKEEIAQAFRINKHLSYFIDRSIKNNSSDLSWVRSIWSKKIL